MDNIQGSLQKLNYTICAKVPILPALEQVGDQGGGLIQPSGSGVALCSAQHSWAGSADGVWLPSALHNELFYRHLSQPSVWTESHPTTGHPLSSIPPSVSPASLLLPCQGTSSKARPKGLLPLSAVPPSSLTQSCPSLATAPPPQPSNPDDLLRLLSPVSSPPPPGTLSSGCLIRLPHLEPRLPL